MEGVGADPGAPTREAEQRPHWRPLAEPREVARASAADTKQSRPGPPPHTIACNFTGRGGERIQTRKHRIRGGRPQAREVGGTRWRGRRQQQPEEVGERVIHMALDFNEHSRAVLQLQQLTLVRLSNRWK